MLSFESFVGLASAGSTAWWLYRQAQAGNASPLRPLRSGAIGWYGDPVEVPRVQQPVFEHSEQGKVEYVSFLRNALQNIGMTHGQALLFIAHMTREGGWGKAVWNYNFGNIKTGSVIRGPWFWLTDKDGPAKYRAYHTAEDGIWDNVELIRKLSIYKKAWAMLLAEDPNWYGELGLAGYYGDHSRRHPETIIPVQEEYNDIWDSVRRRDHPTSHDASRPAPIAPAAPGTSPVSGSDWARIGWASALVGLGTYSIAHIITGVSSQSAPSRPARPARSRRARDRDQAQAA
jgi:hypothetical protein